MVDVARRGDWGPYTNLDRPNHLDDSFAFGDQRVDSVALLSVTRRLWPIPAGR